MRKQCSRMIHQCLPVAFAAGPALLSRPQPADISPDEALQCAAALVVVGMVYGWSCANAIWAGLDASMMLSSQPPEVVP